MECKVKGCPEVHALGSEDCHGLGCPEHPGLHALGCLASDGWGAQVCEKQQLLFLCCTMFLEGSERSFRKSLIWNSLPEFHWLRCEECHGWGAQSFTGSGAESFTGWGAKSVTVGVPRVFNVTAFFGSTSSRREHHRNLISNYDLLWMINAKNKIGDQIVINVLKCNVNFPQFRWTSLNENQ